MSDQMTTISIPISAPSVLALVDAACENVLLARRIGVRVEATVQGPDAFEVVELLGLSDIVGRSDQNGEPDSRQ